MSAATVRAHSCRSRRNGVRQSVDGSSNLRKMGRITTDFIGPISPTVVKIGLREGLFPANFPVSRGARAGGRCGPVLSPSRDNTGSTSAKIIEVALIRQSGERHQSVGTPL
jgi:hypothetical protein